MSENYEGRPIWLITGCSRGLGRELAEMALEAGNIVVVTARRVEDVRDLAVSYPDTAIAVEMDVTNGNSVVSAIRIVEKKFRRIDVLVNNAGKRYFGAIEESDDRHVREVLDVNFFGLTTVTRAVLPLMRKERSGCIVNISSIGGLLGYPGIGFYSASKFAVEGYSEALAAELAPLGIKVMLVVLSGYRTYWEKQGMDIANDTIGDYAETAGFAIRQWVTRSGLQPGCPKQAAQAILDAVILDECPMRLILGKFAIREIRRKIDRLCIEIDKGERMLDGPDLF